MVFKTRYILAGITAIVALAILYYFGNLVGYIILAWSLSMVAAPIFGFFRRFLGKNLSAALTLLLFVILGTLVLWMFIPPLLQQARNISNIDYGKALQALEEPMRDWEDMLHERGLLTKPDTIVPTTPKKVQPELPLVETQIMYLDSLIQNDSLISGLTLIVNVNDVHQDHDPDPVVAVDPEKSFFDIAQERLLSFINPQRIQNILAGMIGFLGNFMITIFSILFISFFFIREQGLFSQMITNLVPDEYEVETLHAIEESSGLLIRYFIGIATQIIIVTTFVCILLSIFGIKNALLIGFFAALMNVIPYIGPILGLSFAVAITFTSNLDIGFYNELLPMFGKVAIVFVAMQLIDNFLIQPFIFGKSVKAHPLEIFLIILVGAQLGGILGMVLAIPLYTVFRVVAKVFLSEFKVIQKLTKSI